MRTTTHHSRGKSGSRKAYGTHHNDRDFDLEVAEHIDPTLTPNNKDWHLYQDVAPELTFTEAELRFYEDHFAEQLEEINQNYRKNRHPERCKDMAAWKSTKQNAPEESLFQIGDMHETGQYADAETLLACYEDFLLFEAQWNQEHGNPFTVLTRSLHVDEPGCPPHIQTRKVWHYRTDTGELRVGQERALEMAGLELPHPDKKPSRYNHRKMVYDAMMREKWLDILQEHGIQVEREPLPSGRGKKSKDKEQYLRDKFKAVERELAAAKEELAAAKEDIAALETEIVTAEKRANFEHQLADAEAKRTARERTRAAEARQEAQAAKAQAKALEARNEALTAQIADQKELLAQNDAIIQEQDAIIVDQERSLGLIQSYEEYLEQVEITGGHLDLGERMIQRLPPPRGLFGRQHREDKSWVDDMREMFKALLAVISEGIRRLQIFEVRNSLKERRSEPARKRAASLNDQLSSAFDRSGGYQLEAQDKVKDEQTK